jgi:hypothetical protein
MICTRVAGSCSVSDVLMVAAVFAATFPNKSSGYTALKIELQWLLTIST